MKKIATAIGNEFINKKIKMIKEYEVITPDIQYQEGIFELLEIESIDLIVLYELLPGELTIKQLINKILQENSKLEMIVLMERKNQKLEQYFINNRVTFLTYQKDRIDEQIEKIIKKDRQKINEKHKIRTKKKENKIITILGSSGVGKSIFVFLLALVEREKNKKILIIDFDILNQGISILFGINKKIKDSKMKILTINKNIDLLINMRDIFGVSKDIQIEKLKEIINKIEEKYDFIFIDTHSAQFLKLNKILIKISDISIFLVEGNKVEIKKSKNLLELYTKEWKIKKDKIYIIYNKINKNSIDEKVLDDIFKGYKKIGKINYNINYNLFINRITSYKNIDKKIREEYRRISKKI